MTAPAGRPLGPVLLDPFTVAAQIANFLILVVALKYVLFDRLVRAIEERDREIAARLDGAQAREAEAERSADGLRRTRREFEDRRERMLAEARADVAERREAMLDEARRELDDRRRHWERALRQDHDRLLADVDRRVADGLVEIVRLTLHRLTDVDLERKAVEVAFDRFADDGVLAREFEGSDRLEVSTSFDLDEEGRHRVRERLVDLGVTGVPVSFRCDPGLLIGVRVRAAAVSVEWSAADYLERFRTIVDAGLPIGDDR